jgi:hypothetical protein
MVSAGSVRTAARRRIETDSESLVPSRRYTNLNDLRRMKELKARRRICGHVVISLCHRG